MRAGLVNSGSVGVVGRLGSDGGVGFHGLSPEIEGRLVWLLLFVPWSVDSVISFGSLVNSPAVPVPTFVFQLIISPSTLKLSSIRLTTVVAPLSAFAVVGPIMAGSFLKTHDNIGCW